MVLRICNRCDNVTRIGEGNNLKEIITNHLVYTTTLTVIYKGDFIDWLKLVVARLKSIV